MDDSERPAADPDPSDTMSIGAGSVAADTQMTDIPRGKSFGRYVVLAKLGAGGMGVVYAAYDPELDRKVALKLLRVQAKDARARQNATLRLAREAQAMARLSHPNALPVYDVGTHEGQLFMAIEMVEGPTLRDWLKRAPRRWREIIAMFKAAGRGLAAAHAVGIVHRDFKPSNVLIGKDGRPRVTDFGIARATDSLPDAEVDEAQTDAVIVRRDALAMPLTQVGSAVGTPRYMAPEQYGRQLADARSDQYGFCVALYEALYGRAPFAGTRYEIAAQAASGKVPQLPKGSRVPAWVGRIVLRGLRTDPAERYPTMDALLDDLDRDRTALWRRRAAGASAVCLLAAMAAGYWQLSERRSLLCKGAERKLAAVWDEERKQAVATAFLATGKSYAPDTWSRVQRILDKYTSDWVAMHTETCEATRLRGEQSEETLSLRMGCLAERLSETRAVVELFAAADAKLVQNAVTAAYSIRPVSDCADLVTLRSPIKLPADAATRAKVEEVRAALARVRARIDAGKFKEGLELARPLIREAQELGYPPLVAETLYTAGATAHHVADYAGAERDLSEATTLAEESRHDAVAAQAAAELMQIVGVRAERFEEAEKLARHAKALVNRSGASGMLEFRYARSMMALELVRRNFRAALPFAERALAIVDKSPEEYPLLRGTAHLNFANTLAGVGRHNEAIEHYRQAIAIEEHELGARHPKLALAHGNLAETYLWLGRYEEARPHVERALSLARGELGFGHDATAWLLHVLGAVLARQGQIEEAAHHVEQALLINEKLFGPEHTTVATACTDLANVRRRQQRLGEARRLYERAIAIFQKSLGTQVQDLAGPLFGLGQMDLDRDAPAAALPWLERAARIAEQGLEDRVLEAQVRFALARALVDVGRDRQRAMAQARQARAIYTETGADDQQQAQAEIDAWLVKLTDLH